MTAREFRAWAEWLIIALLVLAAIVVVVREPGRIITAIIDDPWSNILTIVLSGHIGWISAWRRERKMAEGPRRASRRGGATPASRSDPARSTLDGEQAIRRPRLEQIEPRRYAATKPGENGRKAMRNSSIAIVLLGLTLAGCVPQQQREMVQATTICLQAVYDSPEGAPLRAHQPFNVRDASLAQLANPAFATPAEVAAITAIHPRYQACQKELLDRMSSLAPSEAPIFAKHFRDTDDDLLSVVQRRMTWGDFTRRRRDRSAAYHELVIAEERRL